VTLAPGPEEQKARARSTPQAARALADAQAADWPRPKRETHCGLLSLPQPKFAAQYRISERLQAPTFRQQTTNPPHQRSCRP
jgi:hypothetical protein